MDPLTKSLAHFSRRGILKSGALALLPFAIPSEKYAMADQQPMTANGGTDPYPIPSLDKNGSHAALAGSGVHCHSRKHDFQDGLENHWRAREI